jgi:4-amino-4-deoxy-L-arabinose transferase-like glycosyltransferase
LDRIRAFILAAFVIVALPYAFATPIFEKNDEVWHFAFVRHLAQGNGLPVQRSGEVTPWLQAGSQPPLYYALASLVVRTFDLSNFDAQSQPNQSPQYNPHWPGNKNMLLITLEKRPFGYTGVALAAVALRLIGLVPGVITVWFAWAIAEATTRRRAATILATSLTAFNPMFLTVTTAVSNDGLVIALSTIALYLLLRWVQHGATWRHALLTSTIIALATLAKVSGAISLPVACLIAVTEPFLYHKKSIAVSTRLRVSGFHLLCLFVPFALITGWWFARNLSLYGELTGTNQMAAVAGARSLSVVQAMGEFEGFRWSYLAMFGQFNVPADEIAYRAWDVFLIVCVIGLVVHIVQLRRSELSTHWRALGVLGLHILLMLIAIVRWTMITPASQGRLLFPAIAGVSTLLSIGGSKLVNSNWLRSRSITQLLNYLPVPLLVVLALISPFRAIIPAYTPPLIAQMPTDFTSINQTLNPWAEVLGYRMEPKDARPGQTVHVRVFMRALKTPEFNWSLVTNLYGRNNAPLARFDTFTGGGLLPSSTWQPGQTWVDTVQFTVPRDAVAPAILRVQFGLYNAGSGEIAPSLDVNGNETAPLYDGSTLLPRDPLTHGPSLVTFGELAQLNELVVRQDSTGITLNLRWQTLNAAPVNYVVFTHVFDATGNRVAQLDSQPLDGQFPTTRWQSGIPFDELRTIALPARLPSGTYTVLMGLYDPQSGARLRAIDAQGNRAKDDAFLVGTFTLP